MITEDYVSFETAKLLKEKGFDEAVRFEYHNVINKNTKPTFHRHLRNFNGSEYSGLHSQWYSAPTLQMAMKWLREVHSKSIEVKSQGLKSTEIGWITEIYNLENQDEEYHNPFTKTSYEEACEAAIKYCLENLI